MFLFRVENLTGEGLWYDGKTGENTRLVDALNLSNKTLPMDPDMSIALAEYRSAAESIEQLKFWFTLEDLQKLQKRGFELAEYEVNRYIEHKTSWYSHPLFHFDWVISRTPKSINLINP